MNSKTTITPSCKINIEGMKGEGCIKKVASALHEVKGIENPTIKVGSATFNADQHNCDQACAAIREAGFKTHPLATTNTLHADRKLSPETTPKTPLDKGASKSPSKSPIAQHISRKGTDAKKAVPTTTIKKHNPANT